MGYDQEPELSSDPALQMPVKQPELLPPPFLDKIQNGTNAAFCMLTKTCKFYKLENFSQKKGRVMSSALQMGQLQHCKELAQNSSGWL